MTTVPQDTLARHVLHAALVRTEVLATTVSTDQATVTVLPPTAVRTAQSCAPMPLRTKAVTMDAVRGTAPVVRAFVTPTMVGQGAHVLNGKIPARSGLLMAVPLV